jgi:hypothetical protein
MIKYSGAIYYLVLKKDNRYILIFLDNHNPETYCDIPSDNIDKLFLYLYKKDKQSLFIFEELVGNNKYISLFPKTMHLSKYLQFYNKYIKIMNIQPVDIRILFDNLDEEDKFLNLDILFDINQNKENIIINKIKDHINKICIKSEIFLNFFNLLKEQYILIKQEILDDITILDKNDENNSEHININYPWIVYNLENIKIKWDTFLSSLLEFYTISWIEESLSKYNIIYLGAMHCITVYNILVKYFRYRVVKGFEDINIEELDYIDFKYLDKLSVSCFNYNFDEINYYNRKD